jgi:hypothetical protein
MNTREIAITILFIVFLVGIFSIKGVRKVVPDILKAFFSIKIIIPFIVMILYISLILFILYYLGFLNINLVKDVGFWFFVVAVPLFFTANKVREDKNFFKTKAIEYVKLTTIFGFLINFYTFNIFVEIIFQIILFALIMLITVSKTEEKYKVVENFLNIIFLIIFASLVIFFINNLFINPNGFININTGIEYILPAILTILLLPFIYSLALYMRYELFYVLLKIRFNESKLYKHIFKEIFKRYNLDLYGLDAFLSKFEIFKIQDREDIEKEILKAEKRVQSQDNIK